MNGSYGRPPERTDDPEELKRRLRQALSTPVTTPSQADTERILEERAKRLAVAADGEERRAEPLEVVEFKLAHERYAVDARLVRSVHPLDDLTPLPGTPDFVLGLVNLRGEIASVLDLKRFYGLPQTALTDLHRILFLQDSRMAFGVLANEVTGIRQLQPAEIQPPPPSAGGIRARHLLGVTGDRLVVLDGAGLLADPDVVVDTTATDQSSRSIS